MDQARMFAESLTRRSLLRMIPIGTNMTRTYLKIV